MRVLFCVLLAIVAVATIEAVSVSTLRQRVAERHAAKARTVTNIQSKNGVTVGKQLKSFVRFPQITSHSCYASATAMVVKMMSLTGAKRCPCEVFTTLESPIYNNVVTELAARRSRRKKASGDAPASAAKIEADDSEDEALDDKGAADRTPPEQRATDIVDDSNDEHCPVTPEVVEAAYKRNNPGHKLFTGGQVEEAMKEFGVRGEVYTGKQKLERGGKEEGQGNLPKFDDIKEEITSGRPVVLGVAQSGGAGHAVMIIGARLKGGNRELLTVDPYMGWKDPYWVDWPEGRNKVGAKFRVQDDAWLLFKVIFVHEAPDRSTFKSVIPGENINAKCGTTSRSKK